MAPLRRLALFLSAILPAALAVPVLQQRNAIPGKYIVTLKPAAPVDLETHLSWVSGVHRRSVTRRDTVGVQNKYSINSWQAYAGEFDEATLEQIRANPNVASVVEDLEMYIYDAPEPESERALTTQSAATWGLASLSARQPNASNYVYDSSAGEDTFAYIVDSGIVQSHDEFEGRVTFGFSAYEGEEGDEIGHGTHVASTVGGKTYGVAKKTNIINVKVFQGPTGSTSSTLAGFDWAVNDIVAKGRAAKAVVNMSLGGPAQQTWVNAIEAAYNQGVTAVVAAGNGDQDGRPLPVESQSPANVPQAITVGAIDRRWAPGYFSNYGAGVDIMAPGVQITGAWIGSDSATNTISGTSMASPHVAGLVVYLKALEGLDSPKAVADRLIELGTKDRITSASNLRGSPNLVAYNGNA